MDNIVQEKLNALKLYLTSGSKYIVSGALSGITSCILYHLITLGQLKGNINTPGVGIALPAPLAMLAFFIISSILGWIGLIFLNRAKNIMFDLEFGSCLDSEVIKTALLNSSIISSSKFIINILCYITCCATSLPSMCLFIFINAKLFHITNVFEVFLTILLIFPYIFVSFNLRYAFFNPEKWNRTPWFIKLIPNKELEKRIDLSLPPFLYPLKEHKKMKYEIKKDIHFKLGQLYNKHLRKKGFRMFLKSNFLTLKELETLEVLLSEKITEVICKYSDENSHIENY